MKNDDQIHNAWLICRLMARLGILLWNQYEKEFVQRHIQIEEKKYSGNQSDKDSPPDTK
jgi:hypothetical protein